MFYRYLITSLWLLMLIPFPSQAALPLVWDRELPTLAPMLEKIQPAVVNISTSSRVTMQENPLFNDPFFRRFFNQPSRQREQLTQSLGSGVVVDAKNGYIITNHHVIKKAEQITVTLKNGKELEATLVGSDPDSGVAIIKVEESNLTAIPIGSSKALRVGDFVVAIGNPFGLSQTVTSGIVSALGRSGLGIKGYEDFIQTDASINPGNSGGALVNLRGELIGINTAIYSRSGGSIGIGFAIPVDMIKSLMAQLIKHGNIQRGMLGVMIQDLTPNLAEAFGLEGKHGAVISKVLPDSAAESAALEGGDVIFRVNKTNIKNIAELRNTIGLLRAGEKVRIFYYRDGLEKSVQIEIKAQDSIAELSAPPLKNLQGARFATAEPNHIHNGGVKVVEVTPNSAAWESGLRQGDIILSLNRKQVKNLKQFKAVAKGVKNVLLLNLLRGDGALFLLIQ